MKKTNKQRQTDSIKRQKRTKLRKEELRVYLAEMRVKNEERLEAAKWFFKEVPQWDTGDIFDEMIEEHLRSSGPFWDIPLAFYKARKEAEL